VDGVAYILTDEAEAVKMLLQVKSGVISRGDIAKLRGDMERERAQLGTFVTLEKPTKPMRTEAKAAGPFVHPLTGITADKIAIVTIKDIVEHKRRLGLPVSMEAFWKAKRNAEDGQLTLSFIPLRKPPGRVEAELEADEAQGLLRLI
jgi:Restriction endonuclease